MLTSFIHAVAKILVIPTVFLLSLAGYTVPATSPLAATPQYGSFNPTGAGTYYLQSTITSSQTTINLSSFTEPGSGTPYTMSFLNSSIEYATLAPQTAQSEFISFTGITQNSDGTATLTGVTRGLGRTSPYTPSSSYAYPHSGQTRVILSNPPELYRQYASLSNAQTFTGQITFAVPPIGVNPGGVANSSETVNGAGQLATGAQAGAGTSIGSTGARLLLPASLATSTPGTNATYQIPVTIGGKLPQAFLDLTQNFTWSGIHTFNGTTTLNGPATFNGSMSIPSSLAVGALGIQIMSASTTNTAPMPMVVATSTGTAFPTSAALASSTINFVGFATGNATLGQTTFVQTSGVVSGFTGLTAGSDYYLANATGTISTTPGTLEGFVGTAISTTQLQLGQSKGLQYVGATYTSAIAAAITFPFPVYAREAIISVASTGAAQGINYIMGDLTITRVGKTTSQINVFTSNSGGASQYNYQIQCSLSGNTITCTPTNYNASGNTTPNITGTAYFYR